MHRRHEAVYKDGTVRTIARSTKEYAAAWRLRLQLEDGTERGYYGFSRDATLADASARREAASLCKGFAGEGRTRPVYKVIPERKLLEVEVVAVRSEPVA